MKSAITRSLVVLIALLTVALLAPRLGHAAPAPDSSHAVTASTTTPPALDPLAAAYAGFTAENRAYQRDKVIFEVVSPLLPVLLTLLLLFTGVIQRLRDFAESRAKGRWARLLILYGSYSLLMTLVLLPATWCEEYLVEHRYGLSTQSLADWFSDQGKSFAIGIVMLAVLPLLSLGWRTIERHPRGWWLRIAAAVLPLAALMVLLQPLVFDPMFNTFTPLRDQGLRTAILSLAERADIPGRNVYQVDMSRRTRKLNAYVNGFGASQRIVLWDTTLQRLTRDEILLVMGHEMGHYKLGHIWRMLLMITLGGFLSLFVTARLAQGFVDRFGGRLGLRGIADLACLPLLIAILGLVSYVAQPAANAMARGIEHDADVYGLEITHDNAAAASAFLKLAEDNRADPDPPAWVEWAFYSHPPLADRIRFAMTYRPWERGEPARLYRGR